MKEARRVAGLQVFVLVVVPLLLLVAALLLPARRFASRPQLQPLVLPQLMHR
jgi:hypothetical protein